MSVCYAVVARLDRAPQGLMHAVLKIEFFWSWVFYVAIYYNEYHLCMWL